MQPMTICCIALAAISSLAPVPEAIAEVSAPSPTAKTRANLSYPASVADRLFDAPPVKDPKKAIPKIIGGQDAASGQFPWQAALILARAPQNDPFRGFFCGGSLIDWRWLLTAAHCTYKDNPKGWEFPPVELAPGELNVYLGSVNFSGGQRIEVQRIVRHPAYNPLTQDNDLALLELTSEPADKTTLKLLPSLPKDDDEATYPGNLATVMGWGSTEQGTLPPEFRSSVSKLKFVGVAIQSRTACDKHYVNYFADNFGEPADKQWITNNMICAGTVDGSGDSCFGDSGGPLVVARGDEYAQAGIVSWGPINACGLTNLYGVYAYLPLYRDWVASAIGPGTPQQ
jgi:secreted trypsin-like serine protease